MSLTKKKVRRFEIWAKCHHEHGTGVDPENIIEFSSGETDEEIQKACAEHCDTLVGNNFDTGWNELSEEPE